MTGRGDHKLDVWDLVVSGQSAGIEIGASTLESVASAWGKPDSTLASWARYGPLSLHFDGACLRQVELDVDFNVFAWAEHEKHEGQPSLRLDFGPGSILVKGREYERFARLPSLLEWLPKEAAVSFSFDQQARRIWVAFAQDNRWGHLGFAAAACLTREGLFDIDYYCATVRVGRN